MFRKEQTRIIYGSVLVEVTVIGTGKTAFAKSISNFSGRNWFLEFELQTHH
jgi:hypothetical protein